MGKQLRRELLIFPFYFAAQSTNLHASWKISVPSVGLSLHFILERCLEKIRKLNEKAEMFRILV